MEETQTWSEAEPEATVENAVEFGLESSQTDGDAPLSPQPVTPRKSILKPPKPKPPIEEPTPRASKKAAPLRAPLSHHFEAQRRAVLKAALNPPALPSDGVKETPTSQLCSLLRGTVERGEGNSCLVLGSRGSGKTRVSASYPSVAS